jgi:pyrroline-5-carboxylate reductase
MEAFTMESQFPLGFIGGGNMAEAMIRGLLNSGTLAPGDCRVCEIVKDRQVFLEKTYGIMGVTDIPALVQSSRVVVLAIKPQSMGQVLPSVVPAWSMEKVLISIAAGVPLNYISSFFPQPPRVVRVMPNTPALVLSAISALCKNAAATEEDLALAESLFKSIGETVLVEESHLDAVTGLSGSGPAYVFTILEGLTDGGVKMGLPRPVALKLALQTLWGSAQMVKETGWPLAQLKEMVTSPGGTTIHGLHILEKAGLHGLLMEAVEAATQRSRELGATLKKG